MSLKPAWHQVSGHRFEEGRQGALMSDDGFFFKPVDSSDARGRVEASFYEELRVAKESLGSDASGDALSDLAGFLPFAPECTGLTEALGPGGGTFLRMRDLTASLSAPCVLDVKLGFTTADPSLGETYAAKCARKDAGTTTASLGFRLGGMQVFEHGSTFERHASEGGIASSGPATTSDAAGVAREDGMCLFQAPRAWCRSLDRNGLGDAFLRYFRAAGSFSTDLLHGPTGVVCRLQELLSWFESQRCKVFFGASVLIVYDAAAHSSADLCQSLAVKMVDFAHVLPAGGEMDSNTASGLRSLIAEFERLGRMPADSSLLR